MKSTGSTSQSQISLFVSSEDYFSEILTQAFHERKIQPVPPVKKYLVGLLQHYLDARNLYDDESVDEVGRKKPQTLAEMYMIAMQSETSVKIEMLKKLADRSLYICGFFSDSLQKKIVDIDYYIDMGGTAYGNLAHCTREDSLSKVYKSFSQRFLDFVEVLSVLSQNVQLQSNQNILRMYDRYMRTGSALDREKLTQIGILTQDPADKKKIQVT